MKKDLIISFLNSKSKTIFDTFPAINYISLDAEEGNISFEIGSLNGDIDYNNEVFNNLFNTPLKNKLNFDFSIENVQSDPIKLYSNRNYNLTKHNGHTINVFYEFRNKIYGITSTHSLNPFSTSSNWHVVRSHLSPPQIIGKVENINSKFKEKDLSTVTIKPETSFASNEYLKVTKLTISSVKKCDDVECFGNGNNLNKKGKVKKENTWFRDSIRNEYYNNVIQTSDISSNGDSGSMVLKSNKNQIIGIITGGEKDNSYITRLNGFKHQLFTINI